VSNPTAGPSGRRSTRKRGQAMVEFALVIPLFLLLFCAICDFGFALFCRMSVINAAREGARAAVMVSDHSTIPTVASSAAKSAAASGFLSGPVTVSTTCLQTSVSLTSPATIACAGATVGDSVLVSVTDSYTTFFPLMFGASFNLTSTVQMVIDT